MYLIITVLTMNYVRKDLKRQNVFVQIGAIFVSLLHYTCTLGGCSMAEHWWLNQEALV